MQVQVRLTTESVVKVLNPPVLASRRARIGMKQNLQQPPKKETKPTCVSESIATSGVTAAIVRARMIDTTKRKKKEIERGRERHYLPVSASR
jgi:hypothetical protein